LLPERHECVGASPSGKALVFGTGTLGSNPSAPATRFSLHFICFGRGLCGGERQRVIIAGFLVRDTRVYLVDKPIEAVKLKIGKSFILVHDPEGRRVQ
jgi:hypothetical protein